MGGSKSNEGFPICHKGHELTLSNLCEPDLKKGIRRCRICRNEYVRNRRAKMNADNPNGVYLYEKDAKLWEKYRIRLPQWQAMFDSQGGKCLTCSFIFDTGDKSNKSAQACVDHCHSTGRIRGLLCNYCNRCIGLTKESTEILTN